MEWFHTILLLYLVSQSKGISVYIYGTSGPKFSLYQVLGGNRSTEIGVITDFDIHPCNGSLFWGDRGNNMIYKWNPFSGDRTTVVSTDLHQPTSVAVDWSGNNIYFSHRFGNSGRSRIEVVSADGRSRRVIVAALEYNSADDIYLAFSVSTGRLYYTHKQQIVAVDADGQNPTTVYTSQCPSDFTPTITMDLDPTTNTLYWTDCRTSTIRWMDVTNTSLRGDFTLTQAAVNIAALNDSFYWTQSGASATGGFVYRVDGVRSGRVLTPVSVWSSVTITPYSVRVLVDGFMCPQQGCAIRNGGCGSLCLTTPTGSNCTCSTGRVINNNSCPTHPRNFILFSKNFNSYSEIRILSFDLVDIPPFPDNDYLVPIPITNANANYISYDVVTNRVYWIEKEQFTTLTIIKRAFLDGTGVEVFVNTSISDPRNLAIDPWSRNIYWLDTDFRAIMVASLNNPSVRTVLLVTSDNQPPIGVDLDVARGYLYWSVDGISPRIQRSLMDGSNQVILSGSGRLNMPGYVASDSATGLVFWVDRTVGPPSENDIFYVNGSVAGGQATTPSKLGFSLLSTPDLQLNDVLDLTVFGQWVYWSDANTGNMQRTSKFGSVGILPTKETIVAPLSNGNVCGLVAVSTTLPIVQTGCNSNNGNCPQLCLPTGQVSRPTCACSLHFTYVNGQCVAAANQAIVATATSIFVKQTLATSSHDLWTTRLTLHMQGTTALAVHAGLGRVFWINKLEKSIYSANINGNMTMATPLITCLSEPTDLAVDWAGLNLFWTDAQRRVIEVAKATTGSSRTVLAMLPRRPDRLALDPRRGFLYWTSSDDATPTIYQLPMDGSGTSVVFWTGNPAEGRPGSLLVAYRNASTTPDALYWVINNNLTNRSSVYQASLEGTSPTSSVVLALNNLTAAIAVLGDYLYYTFGRSLAVARKSILDPSVMNMNEYDIDIEQSAVTDMQFLSYTLQPDVHKCSGNSAICTGDGSLCLSTGISSGTCLCPPRKAMYRTGLTTSNAILTYTCNNAPSFLLISTADAIYYLPVAPSTAIDAIPPEPLPLSIGPLYNVSAITYDPNSERVLWADSVSGRVGVASILGSPCSTIATLSDLSPVSLAYDWKGNTVFLTEWNRFGIELVSGSGVKVLLRDLMAYQDLAMNSDTQVLYFRLKDSTIYNVSLAAPTVVNRMYPMMGKVANLSNMVYQQATNALLWANLNASTIEMFFLANQSIRVIASNVKRITGLAAVGRDVLWLNMEDSFIYRYNQDSVAKFLSWSRGLVTGFVGAQESDTRFLSLPCFSSPCSDICINDVVTPETTKCSCPAYRTLISPNNTACTALQCTGVNQFLCSDRSACIPQEYFCDGFNHCRDASDELSPSCPCTKGSGTKLCSNGSTQCFPHSMFCDGTRNCPYGEDESPLHCECKDPSNFQCYKDGVLTCLNRMFKCDGASDCEDKSDERNCIASTSGPSTTTTTNSQSSTPLPASTFIVISIALVIVIILVGAAVTWCITSYILHRRKYFARAQAQKVEQQSMLKNGRASCMSPQQRSDSTSQYSGTTSMGTHSTLIAGHAPDYVSGVKRCASIDLDNPPPSPITMNHYGLPIGPESGENVSTVSQLMPAVPNPSMNFSVADGISDGMSISVSQRNFPVNGTTTPHHDARVLYRRAPGSTYTAHSNGTALYGPPPSLSAYQMNKYQRESVQFRRDADVRSISTISSSTLGTENPELYNNGYDDMMDHDAPPPSPVTEVSIPQYTFPTNSPSSTSGYLESHF